LAVQAPGSDPVVLRVRGLLAKELTVGKPLPAGRSFDLKAGDLVMLLDGKGVRTLAGPGTLVGGVFTRTGPVIARRDRIGGTRAVADRPRPAPSRGRGETWLVDLSSSNTICLPEGRQLILSRLGAESAIELSRSRVGHPAASNGSAMPGRPIGRRACRQRPARVTGSPVLQRPARA
jgi:hypothetical protein